MWSTYLHLNEIIKLAELSSLVRTNLSKAVETTIWGQHLDCELLMTHSLCVSLCVLEICDAVRTAQTLDWLDLTACNLTQEGARCVGVLIKVCWAFSSLPPVTCHCCCICYGSVFTSLTVTVVSPAVTIVSHTGVTYSTSHSPDTVWHGRTAYANRSPALTECQV